jgi:hypothetical protein
MGPSLPVAGQCDTENASQWTMLPSHEQVQHLTRELSSAPQGHLFELLVPPGAERRGNQEFAAQLAHSPRSEAEGGTPR